MKAFNGKDIAELIGIAAIVLSLIFVGMELRQSRNIAIAEQQGAMANGAIEYTNMLVSNSALISKLNAGDALSDQEKLEATNLVRGIYQYRFFSYRRWDYLDHPSLLLPLRSFASFLNENPGLKKIWHEGETRANDFKIMSDYSVTSESASEIVEEYLRAISTE